jgi:pimeloyl-ACP methyl ester carboxylesterase
LLVTGIEYWAATNKYIKLITMASTTENFSTGYSMVNGIKMYYEIHGAGKPLALIHGGGSTIETTFGRVLPMMAKTRRIIAVELQGHGHSEDRDAPGSFEQDADDVATLLQNLSINKADIFGFSNGGNAAMQLAMRHPGLVNKLIIASSFYKRDGLYQWFWEFMPNASLQNMPIELQEAYLKVAPNPDKLIIMHNKDRDRMLAFKDWRDDDLRKITSHALIICGDRDVIRPEHAVEMHNLIANSRLAIIPGGHGEYMGEITFKKETKLHALTVDMITQFLDEELTNGYQPVFSAGG